MAISRRSGKEISEPIVIDHSVPTLREVSKQGDALAVEVEDRWNPIRLAEYSMNAG